MRPRVRRRATPALVAPLALLLISCGGGPRYGRPPCSSPPPGAGPDAAATLQVEDGGRDYCLKVGDRLTVLLRAPLDPGAAAWQPVTASDATVLEPAGSGALALPRGVTGAAYRAARPGRVQVTSVRPPCAAPDANCAPADVWRASIVVRGGP
jgi:hypothetical protein